MRTSIYTSGGDRLAQVDGEVQQRVAAALDPDQWEILVSAARVRHATDPEGRTVPIHDAVLRARRRCIAGFPLVGTVSWRRGT